MVRFHRSELLKSNQATLFGVVMAELTKHETQLREYHLNVDLDVDPVVGQTPCSQDCANAIRQLMRLAISRSPAHGDIDISACRTARGIELEIADSGMRSPLPQSNAFNCCSPEQLRRFGIEPTNVRPGNANWDLYGTHCPQGGFAWSIVLCAPLAAVRAA